MPKPGRENVAGGIYHLTARGNARENIFRDEFDYVAFLRGLSATVERYRWRCHAYCLVPNHYHLLMETPEPNLSRGMLWLNGSYARRFNGRHERVGHVFQGPYRAELLQRESARAFSEFVLDGL